MSRMRGAIGPALPGLLAFLVGAGLLASPWWSKTLPASDYPLVIVLGAVFAASERSRHFRIAGRDFAR